MKWLALNQFGSLSTQKSFTAAQRATTPHSVRPPLYQLILVSLEDQSCPCRHGHSRTPFPPQAPSPPWLLGATALGTTHRGPGGGTAEPGQRSSVRTAACSPSLCPRWGPCPLQHGQKEAVRHARLHRAVSVEPTARMS